MNAIATGEQVTAINRNDLEAAILKALPNLSNRAWEFACANPGIALEACKWFMQQKIGSIDAFGSDARAFHNNRLSDDLSVLFSMPNEFRPLLAPFTDSELDDIEEGKREFHERLQPREQYNFSR